MDGAFHTHRRSVVIAAAAAGLVVGMAGAIWAADGDDGASAPISPTTTTTAAATSTTSTTATTTTTAHDHSTADHSTMDNATTTEPCSVGGVDVSANGHDAHAGLVVHDATDGAEPTAEDCANAQAFYDAVVSGVARFTDIDIAEAEGYASTRSSIADEHPVDHYMRRGDNSDVVNTGQPEGLIYYVDGDTAILLGVVFSETDEANLQQPGGPYTTWHDHSGMGCPDVVPDCGELGGAPPNMLHVWFFEGVTDPFAHGFPTAVGGDGSHRELPFL